MTQREAKQLVCKILASDCYHHMATGAGQESVETQDDVERILKAFKEMEEELERRAGNAEY